MHLHTRVTMLLCILLARAELCGVKGRSSIAVISCQTVVMLIKKPRWQHRDHLLSAAAASQLATKISGDITGRMETEGAKARQPSNILVVPLVLCCKPPGSRPPTVTSHSSPFTSSIYQVLWWRVPQEVMHPQGTKNHLLPHSSLILDKSSRLINSYCKHANCNINKLN